MDYRTRMVGDLPLPADSPVWLAHLAASVALMDRTEFLARIEDIAALARSADRSLGLCLDLLIQSSRPDDAPLSLSLRDSGGWRLLVSRRMDVWGFSAKPKQILGATEQGAFLVKLICCKSTKAVL